MPSVQVRAFTADDIAQAGVLLAERQARERARQPLLNKTFEDPSAATELVRRVFEGSDRIGAAAIVDGRFAGFLLGELELLDPRSLPAQFSPPYTLSMPVHGHAVAPWADAVDVYRSLYGHLAGTAVERGFFEHRVNIIAGDRAAEEAWMNIGFGRGLACAARATSLPVPGVGTNGVEIHRAAAEDIDVVMHLEETNERHHYAAPVFWPFLPATHAAARQYQQRLLEDPRSAHFVAYRDGRPLGMNTFNPPDWINPLMKSERMTYLFQGVVEEDVRGTGVGQALLEQGMAWARDQGFESCALHFATANGAGAHFWLKHGFVPVEYSMARHIDERIAWARP